MPTTSHTTTNATHSNEATASPASAGSRTKPHARPIQEFTGLCRTISPLRLAGVVLFGMTGLTIAVLAAASVAHAGQDPNAPVATLTQVIDNFRNVLVGMLVSLATLFATVGGVRLMLAGGDPGEVEGGRKCLKYAGLGYAVAALAPILVAILKQIVTV
ncbi:pilin [Actinocorallia longicatena]|uniref:TrbC/VIRB2 family protein n=1 Tax=Actinocorallia longicatena TaxID=111803 RepID=A0ABP6QLY0_9ACTN